MPIKRSDLDAKLVRAKGGDETDDEIEKEEQRFEQLRADFIKKAGLKPNGIAANSILGVPLSSPGKGGNEFYLRLERIGNKQYVDGSKEKDLIAWLKLTEKLFE